MNPTGAVTHTRTAHHECAFTFGISDPPKVVDQATAVFQKVQQQHDNYFANPTQPNPRQIKPIQTPPESPSSTDSPNSPTTKPNERSIVVTQQPPVIALLRIVTKDQLYAKKQEACDRLSLQSQLDEKEKCDLIITLYTSATECTNATEEEKRRVAQILEQKRRVAQMLVNTGWDWESAYLATMDTYPITTEAPEWLKPPQFTPVTPKLPEVPATIQHAQIAPKAPKLPEVPALPELLTTIHHAPVAPVQGKIVTPFKQTCCTTVNEVWRSLAQALYG